MFRSPEIVFTNIFLLLYQNYIWGVILLFFLYNKYDVVVYNGFCLFVNEFNADR